MSPGNAKILVVDDDPFVRMMLGEILDSEGYAVRCAVNGVDALEKYSQHPDTELILSDMNMAGMNGLEFIRRLREQDRHVPVIILTVNTEISTALEAIRSGANDYLLKDDNIQDVILISIEKNLEKHRLEQQNRKLIEELARKNRELERLSLLDGLTDIPNRRWFDKVFSQEWLRAARKTRPISLIMIDIDYFKNYNDTYGHPAGDECLRKVARALEQSLKRSGDFVARYGGEEFAAILPNTAAKNALPVAEKMHSGISGLKIPHSGSDVADRISVSMGIGSAIPADRRSESSLLISLADEALYRAKEKGRNRTEIMQMNRNCLKKTGTEF
ncbi:MAG: diguanylate cyclase [Desulfococcaceae bacterium]